MNYLDKITEARKALLQAIEIGEKLGYGIGYLNNALSDIQRAAEEVRMVRGWRKPEQTEKV